MLLPMGQTTGSAMSSKVNDSKNLVRAGYRTSLLALAFTAVLALGACASPFSRSAPNNNVCADKAVQAITTNAPVKGLWACLSTSMQNNLHAYGHDGDGAFSDGSGQAPPVVATHYVGSANGVSVYTVVLRFNNGTLGTDVISIWTDGQNKVTNIGVDTGIF